MDISSLNIPIYYINLKEKTERNNKMIKLFKEHNVKNYTRIEAFSYKNYNIEKTKQKHPCPGTIGELFEYSRDKRNKKQFTRFICKEGRGLDENELELRIP